MINLTAFRANERRYRRSTVVLAAANLLPLAGVLFWGWSVFNIVVLYWLENLMVGAINILKMAVCAPDPGQVDLAKAVRKRLERRGQHQLTPEEKQKLDQAVSLFNEGKGKLGLMHHFSKLFIIPFFIFHYGLFCMVHGAFVFLLLGNDGRPGIGGPGPALDDLPGMIRAALEGGILWSAIALFASHLFSFFVNYLGKGEFRRTVVPVLMAAPYGRIVVLHIAILFGGFLIMLLGSPLFLLVLLIVGKTVFDLGLHVRSHTRLEKKESEPAAP